MSMLIGFTGLKGSGKDTAAQVLVKDFDFVRHAFADKLKEGVCRLFNISLEDLEWLKNQDHAWVQVSSGILDKHNSYSDNTFRVFLQRFGTEMAREAFGYNFWIEQWQRSYFELRAMGHNVVVTDVRFENEATMLRSLQGVIVEITRPGLESDGHVSEDPLPRSLVDAQIANNGSIEALSVDVYDLYKALERKQ